MKTRFLSAIIISLIVGILFSALFYFGFYETWQLRLSDMLYAEKTPLNNIVIIAVDDTSLQDIGRWPWPRAEYLKILPKVRDAKVLGIDIAFFEQADYDSALGSELRKFSAVLPIEFVESKNGTQILEPAKGYEGISTGFVNIITDADGIVRNAPLLMNRRNSFAFEVYNKFRNKNLTPGAESIIINYAGRPGSFAAVSFSDVLDSNYNFTNKIVLVGATAPSLHDEFFTPLSEGKAMSGVEINANILQTLITKDYIERQTKQSTIIVILALSIVLGIAMYLLKLRWSALIAVLMLAGYMLFAIYVFDKNGLILNLVYPFAAIVFTYFSLTAYFYIVEQRERKKIHNLFGKYVSKQVADEIISKSEKGAVDIKGEEREITVLFADIRNFTPVSEKMAPHKVVAMLNTYLGKMTEAVFKNKGTLDKYLGDGLMAVFGAPLKDDEHALDAVKAALEMKQSGLELHKQKGVPKVFVGIGINTGKAVVGNMGSAERVEYTAIGDNVNLASRLCASAKGGQVIVSEETYKKVKEKVSAKSLGRITVKGKEKPVQVYEVIKLKEVIK